MTNITRCLLAGNMFLMARKTLIIENTISIMTLVAKGIGTGTFASTILFQILPLKQVWIIGTMRPIRPGSTGIRPIVIIMAIGAFDDSAGSQSVDQARYIGIAADTHHRMIGRLSGIEFQPQIGFSEHTWGGRRRFTVAIGMTPKTKLVFAGDRFHLRAGPADAPGDAAP